MVAWVSPYALALSAKFIRSAILETAQTGAVDAGAPRDDAPYVAAGTEYFFPIIHEWTLAGRLGYNSRTLPGIAGVTGVSAGLGFGHRDLDVDYAIVPYGGLGITNTVSVAFKF